jgi:U3 small nucleolar RNA-associated protein 11
LRKKAEFRNPDEFYFKMEHTRMHNDQHIEDRHKNYSKEFMKLIRTQDQAYVQHQRSVNRAKIDRMKQNLHIIDQDLGEIDGDEEGEFAPKHIVFMEDDDEVENFDPAAHFNTLPELMDRTYNRPRVNTITDQTIKGLDQVEKLGTLKKQKEKTTLELASRIEREEKLSKAQQEFDLQKNLLVGY